MANNRKGLGFIAAGLLLLAAAFALTAYNFLEQQRAKESSESVLGELAPVLKDKSAEIEENKNIPSPNEIEIPDYVLNPKMNMPVMEIGGQKYIGVLYIPAISVEIPVMSELSYSNLKIAPCRYYGSVYQDNFVIAAHNYSAHFGNLKNLSPGDEVTFIDASGNAFLFRVAATEVLRSSDTEGMNSGDWPLTLFTCTVDGQSRITVRCDFAK